MKVLTTILLTICLVALALPAWSQSTNQDTIRGNVPRGIPGYLDPRTGSFRPMVQHSAEAAPTTPPAQGTIVINVAVKVASTFPAGEQFSCSGNVLVEDGLGLFYDTNTTAGTLNGNVLMCSMTVPYYWRLTTQSSDMVNVGYTIQAIGPSGPTSLPQAVREEPVATIPVPSQYQTTTFNISATI